MGHPLSNYANDVFINMCNKEGTEEEEPLSRIHDLLEAIVNDQITLTSALESLRVQTILARENHKKIAQELYEQHYRTLEQWKVDITVAPERLTQIYPIQTVSRGDLCGSDLVDTSPFPVIPLTQEQALSLTDDEMVYWVQQKLHDCYINGGTGYWGDMALLINEIRDQKEWEKA